MTEITFPRAGRRLRWALIGCGLVIFLWLAPEDSTVLPAVILGAGAATLATTAWAVRRWGGGRLSLRIFVVLMTGLGLLAGLGASLATAALMLLKDAQHGHLFPDYPLGLVGAILARAPFWALAGALAGLGSALMVMVAISRAGEARKATASLKSNTSV